MSGAAEKLVGGTELEPWLSEEKMTEQRRGKGAGGSCKGIIMTTDVAVKIK